MVSPPFYEDLSKPVNDLFNDDYGLKNTLKIKHSTPHGVAVTVENELKQTEVTGKFTTKYSHKQSGISVDKFTISNDGKKTLEASLSGITPGLKLTSKIGGVLKGDVGFEYTAPKFTIKTDTVSCLSKVVSSASVTYEGVNAGGMVMYDIQGEKLTNGVCDYNAGISYGGRGWFAALTTTNMMSTYNLSASYAPSNTVTAALIASTKPESSVQTLAFGAKYCCNPKTVVRAKAYSNGDLHAAFQHKCQPNLVVGMAATMNAKDKQPKFGFNCTLG